MLRQRSLLRALDKPASAVAIVPRLLASSCTDVELFEELSERCRKAGAAALIVQGSALSQVQLVLKEQRRAVGNYPGPLPVMFEPLDSPFPVDSLESLDGLAGVLLPHEGTLAAVGSTSDDAVPPRVPRCTCRAEMEAARRAPRR